MSHSEHNQDAHHADTAPGDERAGGQAVAEGIRGYLVGLGFATLLTIVSFFVAGTNLVWMPSIPVAIAVLAIAQMGVHLVFFLHITTGTGQRQQRHGAGFRRTDRVPDHCRLALDRRASERQHDADGSDHADATLRAA